MLSTLHGWKSRGSGRQCDLSAHTPELGSGREAGREARIGGQRALAETREQQGSRGPTHLEVQVQDVVLMEVMHTLADLLGEQDHVQFRQVVLLICDPVKEFTPIHTAKAKGESGAGLSKAFREPVHP